MASLYRRHARHATRAIRSQHFTRRLATTTAQSATTHMIARDQTAQHARGTATSVNVLTRPGPKYVLVVTFSVVSKKGEGFPEDDAARRRTGPVATWMHWELYRRRPPVAKKGAARPGRSRGRSAIVKKTSPRPFSTRRKLHFALLSARHRLTSPDRAERRRSPQSRHHRRNPFGLGFLVSSDGGSGVAPYCGGTFLGMPQ
jgi:hypothetical protein